MKLPPAIGSMPLFRRVARPQDPKVAFAEHLRAEEEMLGRLDKDPSKDGLLGETVSVPEGELPQQEDTMSMHYTHPDQRISEEKLRAMPRAEVMSVGGARGYFNVAKAAHMSYSGLIATFLKEQSQDSTLHDPPGTRSEPELAETPQPETAA